MKIFFQLLTTSLLLIACGENQTNSTTTFLSNQSFSAIYDNNTDKDFDVKKDSPDLTVSKSYLHVPINNLFGNRIIVIDFNVKNEAFDKNISAAFDGKWINTSWSNLPNFGPVTGTAYVRYLFSEAGRDSFSLIIHVAPGYFGTPTHGAYDGVFGTPHTLSLKFGQ